MKFPFYYFFIIAILGIILLYSYYYYATNNSNVLKLWGKIKDNLLNIYYLSMIISALSFLFFLIYLGISNNLTKDQVNKLFIGIISIIIFSIFWMPLSLQYLKNHSCYTKFLIYLVLFIVSFSSFYILIILNNIIDNKNIILKNVAFYGMIYFFIHVFFFDFILWTNNFFY